MLKRSKGRVYNAVVQALEKTTTKNNWQRLRATLTAIVPRVKSYSHVDQRKVDAVYTKD